LTLYNRGGGNQFAVADWKLYSAGSVLIPTTGGTPSASSSAAGTPADAFDSNPATYWGGSAFAGTQWLQYQFASAVDPATFSITTRNDFMYMAGPGSFTLMGSNDGSTWTTIANYSAVWASAGQTITFTVGAFGLGDSYRLRITSNDGGGVHAIAGLVFNDPGGSPLSLVNGAARASSVYMGFEKVGPGSAFDGDNATVWAADGAASGEWIAYRFVGAATVGSFALRARNDGSFNQTPHTFALEKSTDGGTVWSTLQSYTAATWTIGAVQTFTAPVPASITIAPTSGQQGAAVSLAVTGTATSFSAGVTTVAISGADVTLGAPAVTSATALTVSVTIGAGAAIGSRTITVTTGAEVVTAPFEITEPPVDPCPKRVRGTISPEQIQAQFRQGNSPVVLMAAGEFTPGNVLVTDDCGNAVDGGSTGGGGMTITVDGVPI
jgi:hypothetical protein